MPSKTQALGFEYKTYNGLEDSAIGFEYKTAPPPNWTLKIRSWSILCKAFPTSERLPTIAAPRARLFFGQNRTDRKIKGK
jgi:hypothetical protein